MHCGFTDDYWNSRNDESMTRLMRLPRVIEDTKDGGFVGTSIPQSTAFHDDTMGGQRTMATRNRSSRVILMVLGTSLLSRPIWAEDAQRVSSPLATNVVRKTEDPPRQLPNLPTAPPSAVQKQSVNESAPTSDAPVILAPANSSENSIPGLSENERQPIGTGAMPPNASPGQSKAQPSGPFPWLSDSQSGPLWPLLSVNQYEDPSGLTTSFGWWGVQQKGNPWVVGQWQDTRSSPFWDFDGLQTDGNRTFNYFATGTDNESTHARLEYYGPQAQAVIDFNRFPHAQEHENFNNMIASAMIPGTGPGSGQPVIAQDTNIGENYAIRVDQFEAKYKQILMGQANSDAWLKGTINIWDQREFGDRQSNNTVHCFTAQAGQQKSCHVLSQKQSIDWNTFEVTPGLEAQYGKLNIQLTNTLRVFSANDQTLLGVYPDGGGNILLGVFPYAQVPDSVYDMTKLKIGYDLNDCNRLYGFGYFGIVDDSTRDVQREMGGFDFRWTNTAYQGLNFTTYAKNYNQSGERPPFLLPDEKQGLTLARANAGIRTPVGFNDYKFGERFNWRPWAGCGSESLLGRLSITGGYEYDHLIRVNENWSQPFNPPGTLPGINTPLLLQPNTDTQAFNIGVQTPWTDAIHTYARYKLRFIQNDLVGFRQTNGAVNSSRPDTVNGFEFGSDWFPSPCYGASFNQTIDLTSRKGGPIPIGSPPVTQGTFPGDILDFNEDSYATSLMAWCKPMDKLTLTANAGYFANRTNQNITIGDDYFLPGDPLPLFSPLTGRWSYSGDAVVLGCSANYWFTCTVRFTADYEISDGRNQITNSDGFANLGTFSTVRNIMQQVRVGVDWRPRDRVTTFLRYQYMNFDDLADSTNSGTMNMVLGGMTVAW